jgi:hypothetical protein
LVNIIDPTLGGYEFPDNVTINEATLKAVIVNLYKNPYRSLPNDLVVQSISAPTTFPTYLQYNAVLSEVTGSYAFIGQANISFKQNLT